jgi:hypothetical protein
MLPRRNLLQKNSPSRPKSRRLPSKRWRKSKRAVMATPWKVPKDLWHRKTVAILASGPSLLQSQLDVVRAAEIPSVAINNTFQRAPWASMLYAADVSWWMTYSSTALLFEGLKVTSGDEVPFAAVKHLKVTGLRGYDQDPGSIRTGMHSGYQALHIALRAGASRVLLLGMDMTAERGSHWHGDHPKGLANAHESMYDKMRELFKTILPPVKTLGVEVINCSLHSKLELFEKRPVELCL